MSNPLSSLMLVCEHCKNHRMTTTFQRSLTADIFLSEIKFKPVFLVFPFFIICGYCVSTRSQSGRTIEPLIYKRKNFKGNILTGARIVRIFQIQTPKFLFYFSSEFGWNQPANKFSESFLIKKGNDEKFYVIKVKTSFYIGNWKPAGHH
jgi:hypothetical protein